ncbi:MAG TPA: right-handed parallel beta-helix repeat-containing protein [Gemmatimonadales bacterium]|nr:right-handed parallel beta-helix repeat-containing protein [Gemmatimonadales bacterium]
MRAWLAMILVCAGCEPNRPCRPETLLLEVTLAGAAAQADALAVRIAVAAGAAQPAKVLPHRAGVAFGRIEIQFPAGYPSGQPIAVEVTATAGGVPLGTGRASTVLAGQCERLEVPVTADENADLELADLGDDASTPDLPPPCTYYASPSGDDSANLGTLDRPFATLDHLDMVLQPGEVGCLLPGAYLGTTYLKRGGLAGMPIVLRGMPGAVVKGLLQVTNTANHVVLENLGFDGVDLPGATLTILAEDVVVRGCDITNQHGPSSSSCVILGSSTAGIAIATRFERNRIHDCGTGTSLSAVAARYTQGLVFTDNVVYGSAAYGIELAPSAKASLIAYNVLDGNGRDGFSFAGEPPNPSSDNVLLRNLITNNLDEGIGFSWGSNLTGTGNVSRENCIFGNTNGPYDQPQVEMGRGFDIDMDTTSLQPQYVDRAQKDFRLQPTSPCRDRGPR